MPRRKSPGGLHRVLLEELESRLLLSADFDATLLDPSLGRSEGPQAAIQDVSLDADTGSAVRQTNRQLVVVDPGADDWQQLIADLDARAAGDAFDVVVLDAHRDGIEQLNEILGGYDDLEAIHVVSHGTGGGVQLGSTWLDAARLQTDSQAIAGWGDAMALEADLLLYGCDVAGHPQGKQFVDSLATLTGADVAASDDLTGHASLQGDWDLEYAAGRVETDVFVSEAARERVRVVLSVDTVADDFNAGGYAGSSGSVTWTPIWTEIGEADGASAGRVLVDSGNPGMSSSSLQIDLDDNGRGIVREVDLTGATDVTLTFDYTQSDNILSSGIVDLEISSDGGSTWSTLKSFDVSYDINTPQAQSFDISVHAASNTQLRFVVTNTSSNSFHVDNLQLAYYMTPLDAYVDIFDSASYSGSDGTANWTPTWQEIGEADGVGGGDIRVGQAAPGLGDFSLSIELDKLDYGASRQVDLSGATYASLDFDYTQIDFKLDAGEVALEITGDGGSNWDVLETFAIDTDINDAVHKQYEITDYAAADTEFRFRVADKAGNDFFFVDNVRVDFTTKLADDYADTFKSPGFRGDDGTERFTDDWIEVGEADGSKNGNVQVNQNSAAHATNAVELQLATAGVGLYREADLSRAQWAELSLEYTQVDNGGSGSVDLEISADGGASWAVLQTYTVDTTVNTAQIDRFDITAYTGSNTQVRLLSTSAGGADVFYLDNVSIDYIANDPAVADAGGTYAINEGGSLNLDGTGSSDPQSDPLTYRWDLDNDGAYGEAGEPITASPTVDWNTLESFGIGDEGIHTIGLEVDDGRGGTGVTTTTVTVTNVAPTGTDDSGVGFTTDQNTAFTTWNVLANDNDPAAGDVLSVTALDDTATTGLVTDNGDGTFDYDPNGQFDSLADGQQATDTFTYTVSDGDGGTDTATVTITINGIDDAPLADAGADQTVDALDVVTLDGTGSSDPEGESLTHEWVQTGGPTVTLSDPSSAIPTFTAPSLTADTDLTFELRVTEEPAFAPAVLSHSPISYWNLDEGSGTALVDQVGGYDGILQGTATLGGTGLSGTGQAPSFDGSAAYVEIPHNDDFLLDEGTIQLWFNPASTSGSQGLFSKDSMGNDTGGHFTIWRTGDEIEFRIQNASSGGFRATTSGVDLATDQWHHVAVGFGSGGIQVYVNGNLELSDAYTGGLGTSSGGVGNFEPIVLGADTGISDDLSATPLRNFFEGQVDELAIFGTQLSATDVSDLYSAGLDTGQSTVDSVTITVNGPNTAPVADAGGPYAVNEGGSVVLDASGSSDADGDPLSYRWDLDNDGVYGEVGEPTTVGPTVDWNTLESFGIGDEGVYTIGVEVDDGTITTATTTTVAVTNVAPAASGDSGIGFTTDQNTAFTTADVLANDVDPASGDVLSVTFVNTTGTLGLVTDNGDGTFDYDPNGQFDALDVGESAADTFSYIVSDGDGGIHSATVTITINGTNDAPVADAGGPFAINEGDSVVLDASGSSDADVEPLTYRWDLDNDGVYGEAGEPTGVGPTVDWSTLESSGIGDEGTYTIGVEVDDGTATTTATTTITVTNVAPTATDDGGLGFTTDPSTAFTTTNVLANDTDPAAGDVLTVIALDDTATTGLVTDNGDGTFTYDPNGQFDALDVGESATDTFSYTVSDGDGGTDTATVTITINGTNDAPLADAGGPYAINEGGSVVLDASGSSDADVEPLSYRWDLDNDGVYGEAGEPTGVGPTVDWSTLESSGIGDEGTYTIGVEVDDGTATTTATTTITVTNVAPTATDDGGLGFTTDPSTAFTTTNVLANDTDPAAGDVLTVTALDDTATTGLVTDNGDGTFTYDPNGQFDALDVGESATDTFSYTVSDGDGGTDTATVTITINGTNDAPVADAGGPYAINEGDSVVLDASGSSDADVEPLTYRWDLDNDGVYGEAGEPTGVGPTVDWSTLESSGIGDEGTYTIGVEVDDGTTTTTATTTITVTNVAPTATDDGGLGFTTDPSTAFTTTNVLANDTDPAAGDVLTVIALDDTATTGLVTDNGDGTFTYDPNGQFDALDVGESATDTFSYTVSDGDGGTDTATVTITINGTNDAPVADAGGPYAINEGDSVVLDASGSSDADVEPLTYRWDLDNDGVYGEAGEPTGVGPTVDWSTLESSGIGDQGTYTIGVEVDDGTATTTATTTITVTNVAPTATDDGGLGFTTDPSTAFTTVSVLTNDSDPAAGDVLTVTALDDTATTGLVTDNGDGTFTYDPNGQFDALDVGESATDTFSYTVSDGDGGTDTATVTITINGTNDAPLADAGGPYAINEGDSVVLDASGSSDADVEPLTYRWDLDNDGVYGEAGEPTGVGPTVDWSTLESSGIGDEGTYTIGVEVDDGTTTTTATTTITVTNVAPTATDDAGFGFTTDSSTAFTTADVLADDFDPASGDVLSVSSVDTTGTTGLVVNHGDGTFTYDPNGQFDALDVGESATDTFSYTVSDGDGGTDTATVTITINGANDAPVADAGGPYAINEGGSVVLDASGSSDADVEPLTYRWDLDNDGVYGEAGEPTGVGPTVDWSTLESNGIGDEGTYTIGVEVDDGTITTTATTTITVTNVAPTATDDGGLGFTTDPSTAFTTTNVLANDTDPAAGDVLSVIALDDTATTGLVTDNGDGTFTYDPNGQFDALDVGESATDTFSYTVSDGDGGTDTATVTITINGTNDAPVADAGGPYAINEGDSVVLDASGSSDADGEPLTYRWDLDNDGAYGEAGEPTGASSTVDWSTLESVGIGDEGTYTIGVEVDDGTATTTATTTITVTNVAPTATDDGGLGFTTDPSTAFTTTNVLANDTDPAAGDVLSVIALDDTATTGLVTDNGDGTFTYDPNGQFDALDVGESATDTFSYTVSDGDGGTDTATVTITINGTNDAPVADAGGPYAINEGDSVVLDASGSSDADGEPLTYRWDLDNDGAYGEAGEPTGASSTVDWSTLESVGIGDEGTYTIGVEVDDGTATTTATTTITVTNVAPTATDDGGLGFTTDSSTAFTTTNVLANDTDPAAGDVLTVTALDDTATTGLVTDNGDGTFTYDPNGQFDALDVGESATDTFSYTVSDGDGGTDTATVTITINGTNDAPLADAGGPYAINEGDSVVLDASGSSDADGEPLTYRWDLDNDGAYGEAGEPTGASSTVDWSTLESVGIGDEGTYTIGVEVDDGTTTTTATTTITVTNVAPTATDDGGLGFTTDSSTAFTTTNVLANDTDPAAGDILSITEIDRSATTGMVVDNGDGTFTYDPYGQFDDLAQGEQATDTFSYTVSDGDGGADTATVTITITGTHDAPIIEGFASPVPPTAPIGAWVGSVNASGVGAGESLSFALVAGNEDGAFEVDSTGRVTVAATDALGASSGDSRVVTVQITDGQGGTSEIDITIQVGGPLNTEDLPANSFVTPTLDSTSPEPELETQELADQGDEEEQETELEEAEQSEPLVGVAQAGDEPQAGRRTRVLRTAELREGSQGQGALDQTFAEPEREVSAEQAAEAAAQGTPMSSLERSRLSRYMDFLREQLGRRDEEMQESEGMIANAEAVAMVVTVSALASLVRGGSLSALALSTLPLWSSADPLAILAMSDEEREKLEKEHRVAREEEDRDGDGIGRLLDERRKGIEAAED